MKIKELLNDIFKNGPLPQFSVAGKFSDYILTKEYLEIYKEKILSCDEFKDVEKLNIMKEPVFEKDGKTMCSQTMKLGDDIKFVGEFYLYSLSWTPEIFDPLNFLKPVKDGCCIIPTMYDPISFKPHKHIMLSYNPEVFQDKNFLENGDKIKRKELHDLLDKVLDNPNDYRTKGKHEILIRGILNDGNIVIKEKI